VVYGKTGFSMVRSLLNLANACEKLDVVMISDGSRMKVQGAKS